MKILAMALVKLCPTKTIAALIDCALSADQDEELTDDEATDAATLFDLLCELSPEAMEMAQNGTYHAGGES